MSRDFLVTVTGERAKDFIEVFGSPTVPVQLPAPHKAYLPGLLDQQLVYMLDLNEITDEQRQRLIAFIAQRFKLSYEDVARDLEAHGVPILASDCTVAIYNPQRWI